MKQLLAGFAFLLFGLFAPVFAQERTHTCGTDQLMREAYAMGMITPTPAQRSDESAQWATASTSDGRRIVPIVFHIVHDNGPERLTYEQVEDLMDRLNEDYQKRNADTADVDPFFQAIIGNANIEFRLARIDPNGNPTSGVRYVQNRQATTYDVANDTEFKSLVPGWPRDRYLNIWVARQLRPGVGGYAYVPRVNATDAPANVPANIDGCVILASQFNNNTRTVQHEIGHFLALYHPWANISGGVNTGQPGQAGNCDFDDFVEDTPNTIGTTGGCNKNQVSCGSKDNVENIMDYANCVKMFTVGQVNRMNGCLEQTASQRINLWQPGNLIATGTNDDFAGGTPPPNAAVITPLTNFEACPNRPITFSGVGLGAPAESLTYTWTFEGIVGGPTVTGQQVAVVFPQQGNYSVTLTVSNAGGSVSTTRQNIIRVRSDFSGLLAPFVQGMQTVTFPIVSGIAAQNWEIAPSGSWQRRVVGFDGNNGSVAVDNLARDGQTNLLTSPFVNLTGSEAPIRLSFDRAYARRATNDNDELFVEISTDCGQTWIQIRNYRNTPNPTFRLHTVTTTSAGEFVPSAASDWRSDTLTINQGAGQRLLVRFRAESRGGNTLYIDNISVHGDGVTSLDEPLTLSAATMMVYPNPAQGTAQVRVSWPQAAQGELRMLDALGREVVRQSATLRAGTQELDLAKGLRPGLYIVELQVGGQRLVERLVVQ